eukprot:contig_8422_g1976
MGAGGAPDAAASVTAVDDGRGEAGGSGRNGCGIANGGTDAFSIDGTSDDGVWALGVEPLEQAPPETVGQKNPMQLPLALDRLGTLQAALDAGRRRPVFFLDYDGTLTPIVKDPDSALLSDEMRGVLSEVATLFPTAIVSGRGRIKLQSLIGLHDHQGLYYAGSHGFDISGPMGGDDSLRRKVASETLPVLKRASSQLVATVADFSGSQVENNELAVSVHYRNLVDKQQLPALESRVDGVLSDHPGLSKHHGKCVFELRPQSNWHKGKAVEYLLDALALGGPDVLPIYIGDDISDEDAFAALHGRGLGIIVMSDADVTEYQANGHPGGRRTAATMRLCNTDDVRRFLGAFAAAGRSGRCTGPGVLPVDSVPPTAAVKHGSD